MLPLGTPRSARGSDTCSVRSGMTPRLGTAQSYRSACSDLSLPDWSDAGSVRACTPRLGTAQSRSSAVSAVSGISLPDWSNPGSVRAADREVDDLAYRYGIRRPEEKKRPPSVHSRPEKIQKSSQGVAEWKSHSYALVRDVVAAHKEMKEMLSKVRKKRTVIDTRTKALELAVNDALQLRVTETKRLEDRLATQAQRTQLDKQQIEQSIERVDEFLR